TLLRSRRQQLHTRIVSTLENQFSKVVAAQPQLIARHCVEARLNDKAIEYWLKGGQQAVARSAMTEAVAQLQKGLNLLSGLPQGPLHRQQELNLRIALGKALMVTRGFAAPEVRETFARARALAEQLDRPNHLIRLLHGQFLFHLIRAELKPALLHA